MYRAARDQREVGKKRVGGNGQKCVLALLSAWVFSHTATFQPSGLTGHECCCFLSEHKQINSFRSALAVGGWAQPYNDEFTFGPRSAPRAGVHR